MTRPLTVIVLAAGEGTRMRSRRPKVLHGFAGRSMLGHVLAACAPADPSRTVVVVGHGREQVVEHLADVAPDVQTVVQEQQLGTGHAVRTALDQIPPSEHGNVVIVPGDVPLLTHDTLTDLFGDVAVEAGAAALTSVVPDPTGYGRVLREASGQVVRIVEHRDATDDELRIDEVATGIYAFDETLLRDAVTRLSTDNAQGEYYLPDVVALLAGSGRSVVALQAPADETAGVNDRVQLAAAARVYNVRLLEQHMRSGVTVVDPASTWVDADVTIGQDVTLHPGVELHGTTRIGDDARIGPQTTLTDTAVGAGSVLQRTVAVQARVGAGVTVGPFAYLRPGTSLADGVHVGTYVELKSADVGRGSKVPHLTYVGDAAIGEHTNIGAATVFVNYDGVAKHRTVIGDHARTGADNMFVAPVRVGDGAYTAAGSVITEDVPPGDLAVARGRQRNVAGWVMQNRAGTPSAEAAEQAQAAGGASGDSDPQHPDG